MVRSSGQWREVSDQMREGKKLRSYEVRNGGIVKYWNHEIASVTSSGSDVPLFYNSIIPVFLAASFFFLLLNPGTSIAQNVAISASTGKTSYLVGDYIHYKIEVEHAKGITIVTPSITDSLKNVLLIQMLKPVTVKKSGNVTTTFEYVLSGYDSASVSIPPVPVLYRVAGDTAVSTITTNPVAFRINLLKVIPQAGIKDVKSPFKIPLNWLWILLWVVIGIVVVTAVYYLYRRKKRNQPLPFVPVAPKLLPHEIALKGLKELDNQRLWQKGLIKDYHSAITEIIRRYFEERFSMPALELTTSETIDLLRKRQGTEPILELTRDFLSNADLVKFAKYVPLDNVNSEMMNQAYEIVNRTIPPPVVEAKTETTNVQ